MNKTKWNVKSISHLLNWQWKRSRPDPAARIKSAVLRECRQRALRGALLHVLGLGVS